MRHVLETDLGGVSTEAQHVIEPIFGHTKHNRGAPASHDEEDPPPALNGA